jgi:hypothetical protein
MYNAKLDDFIQRIVSKQSQPIRQFDPRKVWELTIWNRTGVLVALQLLLILVGGLYVLLNPASSMLRIGLGIILVVLSVYGVFAVWWHQWSLIQTIQHGQLAIAEVQYVELLEPGVERYRLVAARGVALGRWHISTAGGLINMNFEIDTPWNQRIQVGSKIKILRPRYRFARIYPLQMIEQ